MKAYPQKLVLTTEILRLVGLDFFWRMGAGCIKESISPSDFDIKPADNIGAPWLLTLI